MNKRANRSRRSKGVFKAVLLGVTGLAIIGFGIIRSDVFEMTSDGGYNSREFYKDPALKSLDNRLSNDGIISIDWNALNGDAEGKPYTIEEMIKNVVNSTGNKKQVVVLMHDTFGKEKAVQILPEIIDFYKKRDMNLRL